MQETGTHDQGRSVLAQMIFRELRPPTASITRSHRLHKVPQHLTGGSLSEKILAFLHESFSATAEDIADCLDIDVRRVANTLNRLQRVGTLSLAIDPLGQARRFFLNAQGER